MAIECGKLKIAAISDLHVIQDKLDELFLNTIRERVEKIRPDVFVIAGDISDYLDVISDSLKQLQIDDCKNLFVAGNHDIWFEDGGGPGSLEKYAKSIGEICRKHDFAYLPDAPYIEGEIAFVGSIGWYDYSFRRPELEIPEENYIQKDYQGATWYDLFKIDWGYSDIEATNLFNQKLEYDLETLPDHISKVVYVSHHLPFKDLTVYRNKLPWDFHSAFMGATSTGDILLKDKRVMLSISGHSHIRNMTAIGDLTAITVPVGYGRPSENGIKEFVKQAIAIIDLIDNEVIVSDFVQGDICAGLPYVNYRI